MKTLKFETQINAPAQQVWDILWNADTYTQWTQYFNPGSQIKSDWKVAGKTLFLDEEGNGIVSTIQSKHEPYEIVFEHRGSLKNGVEDTESDGAKSWAGSLEKYFLTYENGITHLKVVLDFTDGQEAFEQILQNGFAKGLKTVKKLAEK